MTYLSKKAFLATIDYVQRETGDDEAETIQQNGSIKTDLRYGRYEKDRTIDDFKNPWRPSWRSVRRGLEKKYPSLMAMVAMRNEAD